MTKANTPEFFKAYVFEGYGSPSEVIKIRDDVKLAPLQPLEVLIRVYSAGVNPVDYKSIEFGVGNSLTETSPSSIKPFRFGFDVTGVVMDVGSSVEKFKAGDVVYAMTPFNHTGAFAEYIAIEEKNVAIKPANLTFNQAAGVPLAALTSYQALVQHGDVKKGNRVLILGGSGGTGTFAVQLAHLLGAFVVTTTSSENVQLVKKLGADQVIDYTQEKWADVLEPHSIDLLYDCGMEPNSWNDVAQKVLKAPGGKFVTILPIADKVASNAGTTALEVRVQPSGEDLSKITAIIEASKLTPVVDSVYPFDQLVRAIERVKSCHARGKVVVEIVSTQ